MKRIFDSGENLEAGLTFSGGETQFPTFGIDIMSGDGKYHQNAIEVFTTAADRDFILTALQNRENPSTVIGDVMRRLQLADSYATNDELVAAIALSRDALDPGTLLSLFTEMAAHIFKEK